MMLVCTLLHHSGSTTSFGATSVTGATGSGQEESGSRDQGEPLASAPPRYMHCVCVCVVTSCIMIMYS